MTAAVRRSSVRALTRLDQVPALKPLSTAGMRVLFDRLAPEWEAIRDDPTYRDNYDRGLLELPRRFAQLTRAPATVLDVACGTGLASGVLRSRFPHAQITGTDISPRMVQLARRTVPGVDFVEARSDQLPFEDASFELVTSLDGVFDVHELARVCAPGGALYLAYTHGEIPVRRPLAELAEQAQRAGLQTRVDDSTGAWWLWALKPAN